MRNDNQQAMLFYLEKLNKSCHVNNRVNTTFQILAIYMMEIVLSVFVW